VTDLEACEAFEEVALEDGPWHPPWQPCGTWGDLYIPEMQTHYGKCPKCPLEENDAVTAHSKSGWVRWVTPVGGVGVEFCDGSFLWFYGDDVGLISHRD
jgi:hypothetical protein